MTHPATTDRDSRHSPNIERLVGQIYELVDLGHVEHFTHVVEPHPHRPDFTVDVFRLVLAGGRQMQLPYAQTRAYVRGFFAGRDYPRTPGGVPISQTATIRH